MQFPVVLLDRETPGLAVLTANQIDPLLILTELTHPRPKPGRATGLYHFAILFAERMDLGRALIRLAQARYPLQGAADHLVSEAVYLNDPDGNGLELYRDRPEADWTYDTEGTLQIANAPLDVAALVAEGRAAAVA